MYIQIFSCIWILLKYFIWEQIILDIQFNSVNIGFINNVPHSVQFAILGLPLFGEINCHKLPQGFPNFMRLILWLKKKYQKQARKAHIYYFEQVLFSKFHGNLSFSSSRLHPSSCSVIGSVEDRSVLMIIHDIYFNSVC